METSNCMEFNEPLSKESSPVEICRLKSGLNANCLLKVFDYLDENDLIKVCNVDKYFEELIMNRTIKKKTVSICFGFSKDSDKEMVQIFQKFGKSMRKLELSFYNDFLLCLEMIMEHCEPAKLTEVEFVVHNPYNPNVNLNGNALTHNDIYSEFLTCIAKTATNLQKLEIRQEYIRDPMKLEWLKNLKSLSELLIISDRSSVYDLDNCWDSNPKLKAFMFAGGQNITTVGDSLSKCFTGLTNFSDINLDNPYDRFGAPMMERYNFLSTFLHLNSVTLTSYTFCGSDLYYPLVTLAKKSINTLKVYMNYDRPIVLSEKEKYEIMQRPLPQFSYLQTVEIRLSEDLGYVEHKLADCDTRCQFMFRFLSQLKNLQCVKFCGNFLVNLDKVLEHVPKLRTLHISSGVELFEIENIGKTLRQIRKSNEGDLLNLILNDFFSDSYASDFLYSALYTETLDGLKDIVKISFKGPTVFILAHTVRERHVTQNIDLGEGRKNPVNYNPDVIDKRHKKCSIS